MPKNTLVNQIISLGKRLYQLRLVAGTSGNLSAKFNNYIFITATGSSLGDLRKKDIIKVNLKNKKINKRVSSEFPLHRLIYEKLPVKRIIHCHPPLTNAYFSLYNSLKPLTKETKFYLKEIPVIKQKTVTVSNPQEVVMALKHNRLVVLKNHGVVAIGDDFKDALYLIEILEEAVKIWSVAKLFKKKIPDILKEKLKDILK